MKRWWWISLGLFALGAMTLASLWSEGPGWDMARQWAATRIQQAQRVGCPPLDDAVTEGCSRADYRAAAQLGAAWPDDIGGRLTAALEADDAPVEAGDLELAAAAVELLIRGARRPSDIDPGEVRFGHAALAAGIEPFRVLAVFGALRRDAALRCDAEPSAAAGLLIDGIGAAIDLASAGIGLERYLGVVALHRLAQAFDDDVLQRFDRATLVHLGDALRRASDALPDARAYVEDGFAHLVTYLDESNALTPMDVGGNTNWLAWRSGFSVHAYAVRMLCAQIAAYDRHLGLTESRTAGWPQRSAALRRVVDETGGYPYGMFDLSHVIAAEHEWRRADVALQQLRLAVAFHAGEELPRVADALGAGAMGVVVNGDAAMFSSAEVAERRPAVRRR